MWPSFVPLRRFGRFIVAVANDCASCPNAVPTTLVVVMWSMFDTGASGIKKCPLAPVSAMAVQKGGNTDEAFGGLQVHEVANNT